MSTSHRRTPNPVLQAMSRFGVVRGAGTVGIFVLSVIFGPPAEARCWRCDVAIHLQGQPELFQRNWEMCTGDKHVAPNDREKSCRQFIEHEFLTVDLWKHFHLHPDRENSICRAGNAKFEIQYGFRERPDKHWYVERLVAAPPCDCPASCKSGYNLDSSSWPGHPRCVRLLCAGCATDLQDERCGPHESGIGIWHGNVYHHKPVVTGKCRFK